MGSTTKENFYEALPNRRKWGSSALDSCYTMRTLRHAALKTLSRTVSRRMSHTPFIVSHIFDLVIAGPTHCDGSRKGKSDRYMAGTKEYN